MTLLLVSTHEHLLKVKLHASLEGADVFVYAGGARYYGIAQTPQGDVFVVKNTRNTEDPSRIIHLQSDEILPFETPIKDVHQISYANDGIYVCNTFYNSIVYKSLRTGVEHAHTFGGAFEHDFAHPNSVWIDGQEISVLLHNKRFRVSEIARVRHDPARGFDDGWRSELRYRLPHQACHNLRFDRALLRYLASEDARLVDIDHIAGRPLRSTPLPPGYAKGMTLIDDRTMVVGLNPMVSARERYAARSSLGFVDLVDMGFKHGLKISLPGDVPAGNINDIRVIRGDFT